MVRVDLHYESVRREIRIHPLYDIALLYVERMAQPVVVMHHLGENAVYLHDAEGARHLYASVLYLQVAVGRPHAALHFVNVDVERLGGVLLRRNPYLVAIEVALDRHIRVVGQRVLRNEIDVWTEKRRVYHVCRHETARIGAAEEDGERFHRLRPVRVGKGLFVRD